MNADRKESSLAPGKDPSVGAANEKARYGRMIVHGRWGANYK